jgi:bacterial leucyl aminopeptidase
MRIASLVAVVLASTSAHADRVHYVSIGTDALATVNDATVELVEVGRDAAILRMEEAQLEALSQEMHAQFDRCGGFMVHESLEDARQPMRDPLPIEYPIDQPAAVAAVLPALDKARILETIRELSAMPSRHYQSESGAAASRWLAERWRGFTNRSDVTIELFDHGYAQKSVILTIPGTTRANEVVVIGGHLDSISMRGRDAPAPGADDDASGIATLDEVLRVLLAKDFRPARTIKFMAYAAEEVGLRGSLAIVKEFKRQHINVIGVLQLDMTNYHGSDRDIWLIKDFTNQAQNQFLGKLIDTYVDASWGYDKCGYACSDHASWHRAGVPASMPFETRARDRNRKIHTASDTLELSNNNADHAIKFARLAAAYAVELAKGDLAGDAVAEAHDRSSPRIAMMLGALGIALLLAFGIAWPISSATFRSWPRF